MAPGKAIPHYNQGVVLQGQGRFAEAEAAFRRALALEPANALALNNLGIVLQRLGRLLEAEAALRQALGVKPDHARAHVNLGNVLLDLGRTDEAVASLEHACALDPANPKAAYNLGVALQYAGQLDRAADALRQAVALKPDYADAHYALARQGAADAAGLRQALADAEGGDRPALLFALANALERQGGIDGAFAALEEANALHRAGLDFDVDAATDHLAATAAAFDPGLFERLRGAGDPSPRPIFIVGMPRSGTTLVEQIISAHPEVEGLGEIDTLGRVAAGVRGRGGSAAFPAWAADLAPADCRALGEAYLAGLPPTPGKARVTDKAIANLQYVGLIHLILPQAPIIHVTRDPRDVGLSCFFTRFSTGVDYAYDLAEFARYWRGYDALMAHWRAVLPEGRMIEIAYEELVGDLEGTARRLIGHCGLAWDDACLAFHASRRTVKTASLAQVRRPIRADSVGRWRRFEHHLQPLIEALDP